MSRLRPNVRQSVISNARGSRLSGTSLGMGRNPINSRSPKISNRYETPEKKQGSAKKFYPTKKAT